MKQRQYLQHSVVVFVRSVSFVVHGTYYSVLMLSKRMTSPVLKVAVAVVVDAVDAAGVVVVLLSSSRCTLN